MGRASLCRIGGEELGVTDHRKVVRDSFTIQAEAFAATPWVASDERLARLVSFAELTGKERVLDIATGPGYVAEAFAQGAREAVGIDLTPAMLQIARERTARRGLGNIEFILGDVTQLPFGDGEFGVVVTRFSFHHFQEPQVVLREMARVCEARGTVIVEDVVTSEDAARAKMHNHIEVLRDSSHVRAMPLSELLVLFREGGLDAARVLKTSDLCPEVEHWLATTRTSAEKGTEICALLERDRQEGVAGLQPYYNETGKLQFRLGTAILAGRKFRG